MVAAEVEQWVSIGKQWWGQSPLQLLPALKSVDNNIPLHPLPHDHKRRSSLFFFMVNSGQSRVGPDTPWWFLKINYLWCWLGKGSFRHGNSALKSVHQYRVHNISSRLKLIHMLMILMFIEGYASYRGILQFTVALLLLFYWLLIALNAFFIFVWASGGSHCLQTIEGEIEMF